MKTKQTLKLLATATLIAAAFPVHAEPQWAQGNRGTQHAASQGSTQCAARPWATPPAVAQRPGFFQPVMHPAPASMLAAHRPAFTSAPLHGSLDKRLGNGKPNHGG